jgi:protein O-GlcNAc transferase
LQRTSELAKTEDLFRRASVSLQTGNLPEAERLYKKVLRAQPQHLGALNLLGVVLTQLGRDEEAERAICKALAINANVESTQYNHGLVLRRLKRFPESLAAFERVLALNPQVADSWNSHGSILNELKQFDDALGDFDRAIALKPDFADAYYNRGNALRGLQRHQLAIESYDKAIALNANSAAPFNNRGLALLSLKRFPEALDSFNRSLAISTSFVESHIGRGDALNRLDRSDDALASYDKALAINPQLPEGWLGRASIFSKLRRLDEALAAYDKVISLKPDSASAWLARGTILSEMLRHDEALVAYAKAVAIDPTLRYAEGSFLFSKLVVCDFSDFEGHCSRLLAAIRSGKVAAIPFAILPIPSSAEDQLNCARMFVEDQVFVAAKPWIGRECARDRLRIGYLSSDMRNHAVGFLSVGLFEQHDKSRFETIALSIGHNDNSPTRCRMEAAFDQFHDVRQRSDDEIAELIRSSNIDIAVDLNGLTQGARANVLACRPAPIQVNYLGYPGTMGADYIDYIIADRIVIPPEQQRFYSEKVVYLPHCYQVNDDKREIGDAIRSRSQAGLPETGFIFCSFNNSFKITPPVFDIWMRLLRAVDGSVLWLLEGSAGVPDNLRREAQARCVSPDRLIFAPRVDLGQHLARHRVADLFLDTVPYNAHTTASDALWAGLPVVTCVGSTFAGRVAASLLTAIGLPELITRSMDEYEALASQLACEPHRLAQIQMKLASHRDTYPLFDTRRFARDLEAAYVSMWERHQLGAAPIGIAVEP